MKITFSARHFEASDKLKDFATEEIRRLKKYFDNVMNVDVVLVESGTNKSVEIRVKMLGKILTSKIEDADFYKMIPKVIDKLEAQMRTAKAKAAGR